jgi:membrane protein
VFRRSAQLLWRAADRFFDHHGPDRAAAIAFYTLLSLLPMLIFLISVGVTLLGSFDLAYRGTLLLFRGVVVPLDDGALQALRHFVERAVRLQWPGILLLAWTSRRIFGALLAALEIVFEAKARGFARGNLLSFALVLLSGVALLLTLVATTLLATAQGLLQRAAGDAGLRALEGAFGRVLTHTVPIATAMAFFFLVYRFFPRREAAVLAVHAGIGAAVATVLFQAAQVGFAYYVRNLAHYGGLYGALEAVIVLALWLELSAAIVLYGGEIVALLTLFSLTSAKAQR